MSLDLISCFSVWSFSFRKRSRRGKCRARLRGCGAARDAARGERVTESWNRAHVSPRVHWRDVQRRCTASRGPCRRHAHAEAAAPSLPLRCASRRVIFRVTPPHPAGEDCVRGSAACAAARACGPRRSGSTGSVSFGGFARVTAASIFGWEPRRADVGAGRRGRR